AGSRIAAKLVMKVGPDTLLRCIREAATSEFDIPRVIGIDDWAKRKGQRYGTILVDLERRMPIELLPDRKSSTVIEWLSSHPGIEIITRDRSSSYADAINTGAPLAIQVADRWHLLKNLIDTFERVVSSNVKYIREATAIVSNTNTNGSSTIIASGPTMLSSRTQQQHNESRKKRIS